MKKNKLLLVTALLAMSSSLFACNQNSNSSENDSTYPSSAAPSSSTNDDASSKASSSSESNSSSIGDVSSIASNSSSDEKKTEEELFAIWNQGRNIALARDNNYSVIQSSYEYYDDVLESKEIITESRDANRYFLKMMQQELDEESGIFVTSGQEILCIKEVDDNGKTRTKYYEESLNEGEIVKQGFYVAPTYAENNLRYEPKESFDGVYIEVAGDTYSSFIEAFKTQWKEEEGIEEFEYLRFTENDDSSVTFSFAINYTYVNDWEKEQDDDYLETIGHSEFSIVATANGISAASYTQEGTNKYSTKDDKKEKSFRTYQIAYNFDEETYNAISVDTETTENVYYGEADFYLDDYRIERDFRACLVDEFYTLDSAKTYLDSSYSFLITGSDVETRTDLFDLFLDKEFTQPFEGQIMTENLDLYIRLNTEKGAFVEAWFKVKGTETDKTTGKETTFFYNKIKLVYHVAVGETFNKNGGIFEDYAVLEVDGQKVEEGYRPIFVCEEARVYKVLFDAGDTWL